ncbi:hypothetical protein ACFZCL_34875 [Streptomyces sp. NPDC008159]|uniref:hypothetical protein n=1 Tax=Streptomyces sp. NPDC008159 TaxID=3364817 RepID=UPI0036E0A9FF
MTGSKRPDDGVAPRSVEEVRAALLSLNRSDVPYVIRDGSADEGDLVAEWRLGEPAWQTLFIESQLTRAIRIRMRLNADDNEARALEEQWEVIRIGDPPRLAISSEYSRGPDRTISRNWTIERGESGRLEATETFRFTGAELRNPLRDAILELGWTWRGVLFGKL